MQIRRVKYKDIEEIPPLKINTSFKTDFQGSSPAPFIGRFGYPHVNIGVLSPQFSGDTSHYDSPKLWSRENAAIGNIASLRYGLVNSRSQASVKDIQKGGKFLNIVQEVGMAKKAVEVEVNLQKAPQLQFKPEGEIIPFGPQAAIRNARITTNPSVDSRVERVVSDTDLKAAPAVISLYQKGFEESSLNKLLSVGGVGLKDNRKLVPTRWSITAVDDTIGKQLITDIKDFSVGEYCVYFGGGWGNYYLLLFFPEVWSYELFETYLASQVNPWSKNSYLYSTDYENYDGRKEYAEETAGGYYACRISVLEKMKELKRQGSCLALRFITPEYNIPLGVWVCREATRKSLQEKPITFADQSLMMRYAEELIKRKFGFDINLLLKESKLLKMKKEQRKLFEF
ncbi:MAG: hypothetical protein A2822_00810 [Candidatus Staskawiczbacteria bacterium RIFCSPHIGHO2_01_FULL_41_41]|uniref:DNA repair protein n=1 Tax=Candidatus Staskawiczbacteria bacterium RIFCSPHIGHO2_01_FULL_41_41 TaxID=1802203 RepID=A0A1G2HRQ7_9BACT|nr:MAG: hypothetical protein A2822_00810 [Candidatus Staskawiczbacteria bacterium RIFCSPHIGHO2_01_FULL_41_41]HLD79658.1 hypothetical protein [Candidatus Nanoarchaeia archaeon]